MKNTANNTEWAISNKTGDIMRLSWQLLSDGTFGCHIRCGGNEARIAELLGKKLHMVSKTNKVEWCAMVAVVKDWGAGDIVEFRCERV